MGRPTTDEKVGKEVEIFKEKKVILDKSVQVGDSLLNSPEHSPIRNVAGYFINWFLFLFLFVCKLSSAIAGTSFFCNSLNSFQSFPKRNDLENRVAVLEEKLEMYRGNMKNSLLNVMDTSKSFAPPPPPPPPPPALILPPPPALRMKMNKDNLSEKFTKRPTISVGDLISVKLKKTSSLQKDVKV